MDTWMFEVYMKDDATLEHRLVEDAKALGGVLDCREVNAAGVVLTLEFTDPQVAKSAAEKLDQANQGSVHIEGPYPYG
jgi:hypothetical protein